MSVAVAPERRARAVDGVVHIIVPNPWRQIMAPWCRRAQVVRHLAETTDPTTCEACLQLASPTPTGPGAK